MLSYLVSSCQAKQPLKVEVKAFVTAQVFVTSDAAKSGFITYIFIYTKTALSTASLWFESPGSKITDSCMSFLSNKLLLRWDGARHWARMVLHSEVIHKANSDGGLQHQVAL